MKPDKLTIAELFQRERSYVLPLYQRPYVWSQIDQWQPLVEDIERLAEECLQSDERTAANSHFMGAIVLNVQSIIGRDIAKSDVIDGQQRLTTLQLYLAALRDYATSIDADGHDLVSKRLSRLTNNEDVPENSESAFKVWPTNADREIFRAVMQAGNLDELLKRLDAKSSTDLPRMAAAYRFFLESIDAFATRDGKLSDPSLVLDRVDGILQAFRTGLQLVVIELEAQDDPQVIFETLNARGQPLLPSDLVRNYIFLTASRDKSVDADSLYDQYWRQFDERRVEFSEDGEDRFWHMSVRQGRLSRPRIDLFLFHYLTVKTGAVINIGRLFKEFRTWYESSGMVVEEFLAEFKQFSELFSQLTAPTGGDQIAKFGSRLKSLDTSTPYPVLMYILHRGRKDLGSNDVATALGDLESWLIRRFICQLTPKNYNRFFLQLLERMKDAPAAAQIPDILRSELTRSEEDTMRWPDDEELSRSIRTKPIYVKSRPDRSEMVLNAIEQHIRSSKNETITFLEKLSVEHFLPQKGSVEDYPYVDGLPASVIHEGETEEMVRRRLIHTLGNLTLLTRALNSSVSNGPFPEKKNAIVNDSDLRLNAWLRGTPLNAWSETEILARSEELAIHAAAVWPKP